jgi:hypothetical protein
MGVDESLFGDEREHATETVLIGSSDAKVQWRASGLETFSVGDTNWTGAFSLDGKHYFYTSKRDAILKHWDMTKPTLKPIGSTMLPGVLYGANRRWLIRGQETTIRDAVPDQLHRIRYSPDGRIVTVITASPSAVVVNVFIAFNLQLVFHKMIPHTSWPGLQVLHIGFNETSGLNLVAISPTTTVNNAGTPTVVGVLGVMLPMKDVMEDIKKIEDFFASGTRHAANLGPSSRIESIPECRFSWRPGVFDRDDEAAIVHEFGQLPVTTAEDAKRQTKFYESVFANPRSSVRMPTAPEARRFIVPHLFSFQYPWDNTQTVSIFGVVMKHQYFIISIGPSPSSPGKSPDVIRTLYGNDIKVSSLDGTELIEIYKSGNSYVLYISQTAKATSFSGAPMPRQRRTIASPHFLEDDAWYETYVVHAARHVTMPTGWSQTPNEALMSTANLRAFFEPRTFVDTEFIDWGHRVSSLYARPKYLLWMEYGLRRSLKATTTSIFFGGGRYADSLGRYLRSIYDDRMYDDTDPLFPSTFALICNSDYRSQETKHMDAFFRRLHQEDQLVINNSQSISYSLPLACRARPVASLSFIRHLVLFPFQINVSGVLAARDGASSQVLTSIVDNGGQLGRLLLNIVIFLIPGLQPQLGDGLSEPNTSKLTLPLQGFCSFGNKLYRAPAVSDRDRGSSFWEFIRATAGEDDIGVPAWQTQILHRVAQSGNRPSSPFTRLVEEILDMRDRDVQLSFLRVVWLEKLLAWKLAKFGLQVYLTRTVLPIVLLFVTHLCGAILSTESDEQPTRSRLILIMILASVECLLGCYILYTKARQLFRVPRLFFGYIPNYIDITALSLGIYQFFTVVTQHLPSREFLAFSTLVIWVAAILMLRVYRPIGMLLLLLTDTIQEVFSFLALLIFIILGMMIPPGMTSSAYTHYVYVC